MKSRFLVSICVFSLLSLVFYGSKRAESASVNFAEHVAPIIFNNCTSCHRPGEAAPFTLMNYADAKKRGKLLATVAESRQMPPWKADKGDYEFKHERRLTTAQIETMKQWVAAGMPEGNPAKLPPMPKFAEGWQLGKPDLVVKMSEAFTVPADGPDIYHNFALPLNLTEDKWVRAIEFRAGARTVVHHSLFFSDATGEARKLDEADPQPGFAGGMAFTGQRFAARFGLGGGKDSNPAAAARAGGSLGGWAVGAQSQEMPAGLAYFLPKGSDLVLSSHFHPSGKVEKEISTVGIYFADKAPTKTFTGVQLPPLFGVFEGLDIPPGAKEYTIEDSFVLPVDVKAFGTSAHAHYLAKQMHLMATLPTGEKKKLLWINDWDFAWQGQYQFKEAVSLPKGTRLDVRITYDNTADNPRNPSSPPKRVTWGEGSFDEMGSMSLMVVAANESELPALQNSIRDYVRNAFTKRGRSASR
ncbi:MAG: hypothetical protein ACKVZH_08180 [Blastocatellia bacterium]